MCLMTVSGDLCQALRRCEMWYLERERSELEFDLASAFAILIRTGGMCSRRPVRIVNIVVDTNCR